jgi:hypothetical protein
MTRKDFVALAHALREQRPGEHWDANKHVQWDLDVRAITRVCAASNSRFNGSKFIAACGGLFGV